MTDPFDDFIDDLRAVWSEDHANGPTPFPPLGGPLADEDKDTRAAVMWMQRVHNAADDGPVPALPIELARRGFKRRRRRRAKRLLICAAVAATVAIGLRWTPSEEPAEAVPAPAPTVVTATRAATIDLEPLRAASRLTEFRPDQIVSREDGIEFVTGYVRIVLLDTKR